MPMSPRLLRPIASRSLSDADATAYLTAVEAADGQALEPAVRNAVTAFVLGCKSDGIWDSIKASCILAGARTLAGALVPLVGTAPTNNNFTASDYNRETGLVGDGSTTYLDTNRAGDDDPQNDAHLAAYISAVDPVSSGSVLAVMGAGVNSTGTVNLRFRTSDGLASCRSQTSTQFLPSTAVIAGLFGWSRSDAAEFTARIGGTNELSAIGSQSPIAQNVLVFATNDTGPASFSPHRLAFYSIGESLDLAALDTRVSALITAIGNVL